MQGQNIRIRLKAFDHRILDNSTREIVNTARRTGSGAARAGIRDAAGKGAGGTGFRKRFSRVRRKRRRERWRFRTWWPRAYAITTGCNLPR